MIKDTKHKKYRNIILHSKDKKVIKLETELSKYNRKTLDYNNFRKYIKKKNEQKLINNFRKIFGKHEDVIIYGGDFEQKQLKRLECVNYLDKIITKYI